MTRARITTIHHLDKSSRCFFELEKMAKHNKLTNYGKKMAKKNEILQKPETFCKKLYTINKDAQKRILVNVKYKCLNETVV